MKEPFKKTAEFKPPLDEDNNIEKEENLKIFENKYDNEFVGLLNEIGIRLPNFNEQEKSKIKSWINILSIPCNTDESKKNRNLYGIKLINQMINGKLEKPFNNHANNNQELKWLSPKDIKNELSQKFMEEINLEKIENFGILQQKKFLENHPDLADKIRNSHQSSNKNMNSEIFQNSPNKMTNNINNNINNFPESYEDNLNENQFYPEEFNYNNINNFNFDNNNNISNNSYSKLNEFNIVNKTNYNKNLNDKIKLVNIIRNLEQKVIERDEIIEYQNKQIEQIHNRILFIQNLQNNKV